MIIIKRIAKRDSNRSFKGLICGAVWAPFFHLSFNYLNAKNDYRLFKFWMKLTLELPVKSDSDYQVAGLSQEENKRFWSTENRINNVWYRAINWYIAFISIVYNAQLFLVRFEGVEILSFRYIFFQALHVLIISHGLFSFLHCFFTINMFYVTCMLFFTTRFRHIGKEVERMSVSKSIDNRILSRLIIEHNRVHYDLIQINEFFKFNTGFNLISFYGVVVPATFAMLLDLDWRYVRKQFKSDL